MRILYLAYPLLPVSEESAGGAEQVLWTLEREMAARGYATAVAACAGSRITGELIATGDAPQEPDRFEQRNAEHCARVIDAVLSRESTSHAFDLIHDMSGHFWRHAASVPGPVLATLHLPRSMYQAELFKDIPPNVSFNCVSESQGRSFLDLPRLQGVVHNGIAIEKFSFEQRKHDYLLWMGRICEEKGPHIAIDVAGRAGLPLVLAGSVYPFSYHQQFFAREIAPRLREITYVESPSFAQKAQLLQDARAVLLTSTVEETSSLVAMEAMACGTPVIAFRRGALTEVVADGVTGFVVRDVAEMVAAIARAGEIRPVTCRERVEQMFASARMAREYARFYKSITAETQRRREGARQKQIPSSAA